MTDWHVIVGEGGALRQVASLEGEDIDGKTVFSVDRPGDLALEIFDTEDGGWRDNMPAVRAVLIARIDKERETRQQAELTPGTAKAVVYAQKAREVELYRSTPGTTRTPDAIARDFPAAAAEMSVTGDALADVIARWSTAAAASNAIVFRLDALATCAKEKVRSARDAESARAAAAVDWSA